MCVLVVLGEKPKELAFTIPKYYNFKRIYNDKLNKYSLAPNFDMEMCFKPARAKDYDCEFSMVNIDYCNL